MIFSELVKHVREELGMSQEELARALNNSYVTINLWENNKTRPNKLTLKVFFDFCNQQGIDINSLSGLKE